jgi:hypothetical protein
VIARRWQDEVIDAIGPYPITCLAADSDLRLGLEALRSFGLVSVVLVVDGLVGPSIASLQDAFTFHRPFKTHYLVDESTRIYRPSKHHRHEIRRAERAGVEIKIVQLPDILDAWIALYAGLISRHSITGVQRFSRAAFEALARCDGLVAVAAFIGQQLVSCHLWFQYKHLVWSHLAATDDLGYANAAAYAVYDRSIRHFSGCVINLGGGAGNDDLTDGLTRIKAGFSNHTLTAHLIGSVLDPVAYRNLCNTRQDKSVDDYFPAYRAPRFAARDDTPLPRNTIGTSGGRL